MFPITWKRNGRDAFFTAEKVYRDVTGVGQSPTPGHSGGPPCRRILPNLIRRMRAGERRNRKAAGKRTPEMASIWRGRSWVLCGGSIAASAKQALSSTYGLCILTWKDPGALFGLLHMFMPSDGRQAVKHSRVWRILDSSFSIRFC